MQDTGKVLQEVLNERLAQDRKWGQQNHPDGTSKSYRGAASVAREECDNSAQDGTIGWLHILREEFYEASAETDQAKLRNELIQVAAVAVAWVECIDRREKDHTNSEGK